MKADVKLKIAKEYRRKVLRLSVLSGNTEWVKKVIALGVNINKQEFDGKTPLMLASANGHTDCVQPAVEV